MFEGERSRKEHTNTDDCVFYREIERKLAKSSRMMCYTGVSRAFRDKRDKQPAGLADKIESTVLAGL